MSLSKKISFAQDEIHSGETICPYCAVGCRVWVEAEGNRLLRVKGVKEARANQGRLCPKGATLTDTIQTKDRLTVPLIRDRRGRLIPSTWPTAISLIAKRFQEIRNSSGPDSLAWYGSGQLDTEAIYLAVKLFKGIIGTNNTDANSRLCMANAAAAYWAHFGSDGPGNCYDDIHEASVIMILGSNMAHTHPVLFQEVEKARKRNGSFVIVLDPRRTATARAADLHLAIRPGGDIAFFILLARMLKEKNRFCAEFIKKRTSNYESYERSLQGFQNNDLLRECGLCGKDVQKAVSILSSRQGWLSFYCMGLAQSREGLAKHHALINLHLAAGEICKPGAGPFSLTGQANAMGGREAGYLSNMLPGYRFVARADHRREVEKHWNLPHGSISPRPGLKTLEMFRAMESGRLRAMMISCTNPMVSLPNLHQVRRALNKTEFLVVADAYHPTETTQMADVVLPAAQWSEKEGTMTNSERMVSWSEKIVNPPGDAIPDWEIFSRIGKEMGAEGFSFSSSGEIWNEYAMMTKKRPCDQSGITRERLMKEREIQWPCSELSQPGKKRRYEREAFPTSDGKARFIPVLSIGPADQTDKNFPLILTTGRISSQWHSRTRTGKVAYLIRNAKDPFIEIHPQDAVRRDINQGNWVEISSRYGFAKARAKITREISRGVLFFPFHWGDSRDEASAANYLFSSTADPSTGQPEYKYTAVELRPWNKKNEDLRRQN